MTLDESHEGSNISMVEKSDHQIPEKSPGRRASEDPECDAAEKQQTAQGETASSQKPPALAQALFIGLALWFAVFLIALDETILGNAIPSITDDFQRLSDVGWYGSGYLLTQASFQLFFGRVYSNFSIKYTFLAAIAIFELGSLICGVAPTSATLIAGRAIAGLGSSGIISGALIIIAHSMPLRIRPIFIASTGVVFAVAAVLGPVLGGLLTTKLTWRWCFYINLPFGGATILAILLFLQPIERPELNSLTIVEKLKRIDIIGLLIFIPAIVCLLLALQWGGSTYQWHDGRIISLFVLFTVLVIAFLAFEYWKGPEATLPIRILARRSVMAATWNGFCNGAVFFIFLYYIPFWHQVIYGVDPVESGIRLLPLILGYTIMAMISGGLVSKFGYYTIMMILASIIAPIGEGLMTTWTVDTSFSHWVGYQALTGMGIGLGQQQPMIAIQTVLPKADVASGTAILMLVQTISGAVFVSVGQSVLQNELLKNLEAELPNGEFDASILLNIGATQVRSLVPPQYLQAVLVAYNAALIKVFMVGLCMSALSIIGSLTMEWKSVKKIKEDT